MYGDGKQTRSFQYVSDLVRGLVMLMNSNYTEPVNLGNPDEHAIVEFATLIRQLTSSLIHTPILTESRCVEFCNGSLTCRQLVAGGAQAEDGGRPAAAPAEHHARLAAAALEARDEHDGRPQEDG